MRFRFLFLNEKGEEVELPSLEALQRQFEAGTLTADTLLYDALTREWAPARSHPVCELFFEEMAKEGSAQAGTSDQGTKGKNQGTKGKEEAAAEPELSPAALEEDLPALEPAPEAGMEQETLRAFLESRERERKDEELRASSSDGEVTLVDPAQETVSRSTARAAFRKAADEEERRRTDSPYADTGEEAPRPRTDSWPAAPGETAPAPGTTPVSAWQAFNTRRRRRGNPGTPRPRNRRTARSGGETRQAALLVLLLGVGGWGIMESWSDPVQGALLVGEATAHETPRPPQPEVAPGPLVPSIREAHQAAFNDMVVGMESVRARMRVGDPPRHWMGGPYLADARGFPEVVGYWKRYQTFVDTLRAQEEEFFRNGFVEQMRAQGISGSALSIRVARALQDFRADAPRRAKHYDAMDSLATASLGLHDFLVERHLDIRYTPVDQGLTEDPILEISTTGTAVREELWTHLDRLLDALDQVAGPDPDRRRDVSRQILGTLGEVSPSLW